MAHKRRAHKKVQENKVVALTALGKLSVRIAVVRTCPSQVAQSQNASLLQRVRRLSMALSLEGIRHVIENGDYGTISVIVRSEDGPRANKVRDEQGFTAPTPRTW